MLLSHVSFCVCLFYFVCVCSCFAQENRTILCFHCSKDERCDVVMKRRCNGADSVCLCSSFFLRNFISANVAETKRQSSVVERGSSETRVLSAFSIVVRFTIYVFQRSFPFCA